MTKSFPLIVSIPDITIVSLSKIFDSEEIRVGGYVKGGDIEVQQEIQLNNASLEKISRLIQTGALNHCGLKLNLETDKWRTIDFCKDTGYV